MIATDRVRAILSFVQSATLGSFAAAAKAQGLSSAAISKNVSSLEKALGVRLFNRTTRSLQLTEEGSAFLGQARIALDALETAVEGVVGKRNTFAGKIRLSSSTAFGYSHLMPALNTFMRQWPEISLEVDFDDRPADLIREGYDFVIRGGVIRDSGLVARRIATIRNVLVASPAYLEEYGIPLQSSDLSKHNLICVRFLNGAKLTWQFAEKGFVIDLLPHGQLTVSDAAAAANAAVRSMGIAQTAVHHAWEYLQAGQLKLVLFRQFTSPQREIVIQYAHRALQAPRIKHLIDYLLDTFSANSALQANNSELQDFHA